MQLHQYHPDNDMFDSFRINCRQCSGLCCVALYCSKMDGFPTDKAAGVPCSKLDSEFRCTIHAQLNAKQMKGCTAYDCCGAGQLVTSRYEGESWKSNPQHAGEIFDVFVKVYYLQQMLWYLTEAATLLPAQKRWGETALYRQQIASLLQLPPKQILHTDMEAVRTKINPLLIETGQLVKKAVWNSNRPNKNKDKKDFIAHNFKKAQLDGCDFTSSLLIAANLNGCSLTGSSFLGADLRDTSIKNADLSESIFLTQGQLNAAKGDKDTRIPKHLIRPDTWS